MPAGPARLFADHPDAVAAASAASPAAYTIARLALVDFGRVRRIWDYANFNKLMKLATLIGGGVGLWFLYIRTRAADNTAWSALKQAETAADQAKIAADRHEEQTRADRDRRITESFAKAVEQLGSDKQIATRLGGIYMLERSPGRARASIGRSWRR